MKKVNEVEFLSMLTKALYDNFEPLKIVTQLTHVFSQIFYVTDLSIYTLNKQTGELRDFVRNWIKLNDEMRNSLPYSLLTNSYKNSFILNNNIFTFDSSLETVNFKIILKESNVMVLPLFDKTSLIGFVKIIFDDSEFPIFTPDFIKTFQVTLYQISSALLNYQLGEQMKINLEFYGSLKNIAKIIETQYELTYIIPLIGEMLDRFIEDHLIYVFLRENDKFKLMWPNSCHDERAKTLMSQLDCETSYLLSEDGKLGAFGMVCENNLLGCVIAKSLSERLKAGEIDYLEQLTKQASITINRANSYSEVLQYATLDALTNINNRRQLETRLKQETSHAERQGNPLSVLMLDIDYFKNFNDTYGHAVGDLVLKEVANTVKENLRDSDIPARYGGEEICVLLPFTDLVAARQVAERVRQGIENHIVPVNINGKDEDLKITVSIGVAQYTKGSKPEDLYIKADEALYLAKKNGRNRVEINDKI